MKIYGVIAEYDPFHNGHRYHLEQTRSRGATHIAAVMSGNATQRGTVAMFDKHFRAKKACENGADLVFELPCPYSCSSAELFALGGVSVLKGLGVVEGLSFGSETEDIGLLEYAAECSQQLKDNRRIKELTALGVSYPAAADKACRELFGDRAADVLANPNDLLAVEYIKACKKLGAEFGFMPVKRHVPHNGSTTQNGIASGFNIRKMVLNGEDSKEYVPYDLKEAEIFDNNKMVRSAAYRFKSMEQEEIAEIPDCSAELAARIASYLKGGYPNTMEEFYEGVKTRNVTLARVRRVILYGMLGVRKSDFSIPLYGRILAANDRGTEILGCAKGKSSIMLSHSLAKLRDLSSGGERLARLDCLSSELQKLCGSGTYTDEFSLKFSKTERTV